eukprot:13289525-Alexandrium_andersonii.AAC.1
MSGFAFLLKTRLWPPCRPPNPPTGTSRAPETPVGGSRGGDGRPPSEAARAGGASRGEVWGGGAPW